jgi:hypothetical protein
MRHLAPKAVLILGIATLFVAAAHGFTPKEPASELDQLVFVDPQLRIVEVAVDATAHGESIPAFAAMERFRSEHGQAWRFTVDLRRGVPTLLGGGALEFIPGSANDLNWDQFAPGCTENSCIPVARVEALARDFIQRNEEVFGISPDELALDPAGSGPVGDSMYFLRFQWKVGGVPVDRGAVFFRINRGNLIQVATQRVSSAKVNPVPTIDLERARTTVTDYLGPFGSEDDHITDNGSLLIVPVTPSGQNADSFAGEPGSGIDYRLAYRFAFSRTGVLGSWEALVDGHTGELIRFVDTNRYGRVHGGAYPGDNHTGEADRPFAYADTGLPAPNDFADAGGSFPGDNATTTLQGKFARIFDSCGSISNTTTTGDVDFSLGSGTDCAVPPGNTGGAGNTHAARTQYFHLTTANLRAQAYLPSNSWLQNSYITVFTNQSPLCNASSGGNTLNFYRAASGCWNLGEIPGVALHEWGHSLDNFDGSGGQSEPVETYADWMAALHLHDSCVGRGFLLSNNCSGYGDACTNCTGIRDIDYTQHQSNTPWTAANFGTVWSCGSGSYQGPCGVSDHCESGISSQALWDFVTRKLTAAPYNMDQRSAWLLADQLWYQGIGSLGAAMYNCSFPNSDGCSGGSLYNVMLAMDDDGDGTANGTPHAAAIFSALDDHNIACGNAGDPQNQDQSSCPSLGSTTLIGAGSNNTAELSWDSVSGASRYFIYRNDIGCDAGMTRIAEVDAPTTSYIDTSVVNDIFYYYLIQAVGASDGCTGPVSNCEIVTPIPCEIPGAPTGLSATPAGDNQIDLDWAGPGPSADSYNVYRAIGTCPQAEYELIATGVSDTSFTDDTVSGGLDYAYVVTSKDVTGGCESVPSTCADAQTTGICVEPPAFDGLQTVTNPGQSTCTLNLGWDAATAYCGGPVSYDVYRSDTPDFTPAGDNLIATGVVGTEYADASDIVSGDSYYYIVRAEDGANGVAESNTHAVGAAPSGPFSDRFADDFEGANQGWLYSLGTPAASTGDFLIGDPVATTGNAGAASQPGDDHTPAGVNCLYTDENPGGSAGVDDIDGGEVIATSPTFDGSSSDTLVFDGWRWFFNEDNDDSGDYYVMEVSNDGGASWSEVETIPGTVTDTNSWTNVVHDLAEVVTPTSAMKIRFRAADGPSGGDLVELAIDDIVITGAELCTSSTLPLPGSFAKMSPADGATGQPTDITLSWQASSNATSYEYCIDTTDDDACSGGWTAAGGTSVDLVGLDGDTTYYWQIRAQNTQGTTEADGGSWWDFTTETLPLPGSFAKVGPEDRATGLSTDPTLQWTTSDAATGYEYCIDTTDDDGCDGSWTYVGDVNSVDLSGLVEWTEYFWQIRGLNTQGGTEADGGEWWSFITTPLLLDAGFDLGTLDEWSGVTQ